MIGRFKYVESTQAGVIIDGKIKQKMCHKFVTNYTCLFGFYVGDTPIPTLDEYSVYNIIYTPYTNFVKIHKIERVKK